MKKIESILLIDDSDATNELNKYYLEELDLHSHLTIKKNGEDALKYIKSAELLPQIIFLDVKMPRMDGFEFLDEYIKLKEEITKSIKIVLLTTSSNIIDLKKAEKYTVITEILMKPLDEEKIKNVLLKLNL